MCFVGYLWKPRPKESELFYIQTVLALFVVNLFVIVVAFVEYFAMLYTNINYIYILQCHIYKVMSNPKVCITPFLLFGLIKSF